MKDQLKQPVYMYRKDGKVETSTFSPAGKAGINLGLCLFDTLISGLGIKQKNKLLDVFGFEDSEYVGQITIAPVEPKRIDNAGK